MVTTILVTGFAPFPGAPINPTTALVASLARRRPHALSDMRIATHVFATRYAAVDRELPALVAREKPDAIMLFGVAPRAKSLRIELIARNRVSMLFPDAGGKKPSHAFIEVDGPPSLVGRCPPQRLFAAVRTASIGCVVSRNAGAYLCNYAYWRALKEAGKEGGPRLVVLIHVPALRMKARPRRAGVLQAARSNGKKMPNLRLAQLTRAAETLLIATRAVLRGNANSQTVNSAQIDGADRQAFITDGGMPTGAHS